MTRMYLEELQPPHYILFENKAKSPTILASGESCKKKIINIEPQLREGADGFRISYLTERRRDCLVSGNDRTGTHVSPSALNTPSTPPYSWAGKGGCELSRHLEKGHLDFKRDHNF